MSGSGYLLAINSIITSLDYFDAVFSWSSKRPSFIYPLWLGLAAFLVQILSIIKAQLIHKYSRRLILTNAFSTVISFIILCIICEIYGEYLWTYWVGCLLVGIIGLNSSVYQTIIIGLGGYIGPQYMKALLLGNALSGAVVSIFRIITLAAFDLDGGGYIYIYIYIF